MHASSEVVPRFLYLGSLQAAVEVDLQRQLGITHVLSVTDVLPRRTQLSYGRERYLYIKLLDEPSQELPSHLPAAFAFLGTLIISCSSTILVQLRGANWLSFLFLRECKRSRRAGVGALHRYG